MSSPSQLPALSSVELHRVSGGAAVKACTPDNPTGETRPEFFMGPDNSGPSISQQVIQNTDRAMAPWKLFNGLFGGAAAGAPRPNMPAPSSPTIR